MPRVEARAPRALRQSEQAKVLAQIAKETQPGDLAVFALQELNPVSREITRLQQATGFHFSSSMEANVGLRIGRLSYPPFLQEGLGFLVNQGTNFEVFEWALSGQVFETKIPGTEIKSTLQLAERRGALGVKFQHQGLNLGFLNTHLHHGPPDLSGANPRRKLELETLLLRTESWKRSCDHIFLMGDFNFEKTHLEHEILAGHGFHELSLGPHQQAFVTWDPLHNPVCAVSCRLDVHGEHSATWDQIPHSFDHIFSWSASARIRALNVKLFGNGPSYPSDHYGLALSAELP